MFRAFPGRKVVFILFFTLLSFHIVAQDKRAQSADIDFTEDAIIFENTEVAANHTLTLIGPDGMLKQVQFEGDETPFVDTLNDNGFMLPDGLYKYELVSMPQLEDDVRDLMARGGDRDQIAQRLKTLGGVISGTFRIHDGALMDPEVPESRAITRTKNDGNTGGGTPVGGSGGIVISQSPITDSDGGQRDQVIADDLIVDGSACIGFDCVNGESFGFDTIRLKENNLRIKFEDTSAGAFPSVDWQLTANASANGGANKFSIDDISGGRTPFTVEANAPSNSLYVDDGGRLGLGTSIPVADIHAVSGNSPTLRLEQNGSSGFAPQTWDVAGNETNFFVRDATNGSTLPLRIRPGAPSSVIFIDTDGDLGINDTSPDADLDVNGTFQVQGTATVQGTSTFQDAMTIEASGSATLQITDNGAAQARTPIRTTNQGPVTWRMDNDAPGGSSWALTMNGSNNFIINETSTAAEVTIQPGGNVTIAGSLTEGSSRHIKHGIEAVDNDDVLARLAGIPVNHWRYNHSADVKHMGVMAQDFYAAFGLGASECGIASVDSSGVAFASIQALHEQAIEREAEIETLKERLAKLEALLANQ